MKRATTSLTLCYLLGVAAAQPVTVQEGPTASPVKPASVDVSVDPIFDLVPDEGAGGGEVEEFGIQDEVIGVATDSPTSSPVLLPPTAGVVAETLPPQTDSPTPLPTEVVVVETSSPTPAPVEAVVQETKRPTDSPVDLPATAPPTLMTMETGKPTVSPVVVEEDVEDAVVEVPVVEEIVEGVEETGSPTEVPTAVATNTDPTFNPALEPLVDEVVVEEEEEEDTDMPTASPVVDEDEEDTDMPTVSPTDGPTITMIPTSVEPTPGTPEPTWFPVAFDETSAAVTAAPTRIGYSGLLVAVVIVVVTLL